MVGSNINRIRLMEAFTAQMHATGKTRPPKTLVVGDAAYALSGILKDDFFATTALYYLTNGYYSPSLPQRVILKVNRAIPFYGLPLHWLGRLLTRHELGILRRLDGIGGIARVLARHNATGFIYEYIPGWTLDQDPGIPDHFFDQLRDLIDSVHSRNIVYVDTNKRGNIIVGDDGRPHLIDFQISLYLPGRMLAPLRRVFHHADIYHLCKHKLNLAPKTVTVAERNICRERSPLITLHRIITYPYRWLRRAFFRYLYTKDILHVDPNAHFSRENHPARFLR
jgi:hypothetical protein